MKPALFLSLAIFFAACNSQSDESSTSDVAKDTSALPPAAETGTMNTISSGCYISVFKKDTALLNLSVSGTDISGELNFALNEKDRNKGSLKGTLQNDMIVANYTFQAEGVTSVRQVAFRTKGDSLVEGYGDIEMKGDTARFKDVNHLEFHEDRPFIKTECK